MRTAVKLQITAKGGVQMLNSDHVDLSELGKVRVFRASHVEFNDDRQLWFVQSARTKKILRDDFQTRGEALAWEKQYYSPGGKGWGEIE